MELTREEAVSEHRKMWNWIADKIEEEKRDQDIFDLKEEYCNREGYNDIRSDCFCCGYTKYICDYCPIEWEVRLNIICVLINTKHMMIKDCIHYVVTNQIGGNRQN